MMYKIISGFLFAALIVVVSVGGYKVWRAGKENIKLSNQLAQSEKVVQETKSAYSVAAQIISNLEVDRQDLRDKIDERGEKIASLGQVNLKLKDQLFKITNAKVTVVDSEGQPTEEQVSCDVRQRVDFEQEKDLWRVSGFCLTSPPSAEVTVSWSRSLQLAFIMTKKDNQYRLYLDNNSPDTIAIENISLRIDPSVFSSRWYQKLMFSVDLGWSGSDPTIAARGTVDIGSFAVGPFIGLFNGKDGLTKSIGASVGWRPFN